MGVRRKGKRKLVYHNSNYYWYMKFTDDWMCAYNNPQLHIVSEDKKIIISYQPKQQNDNPFLILKKGQMEGLDTSKSWIRIKIPNWNDDEITPGFVKNLLDWFYDSTKTIQLVDYLGRVIESK